MCFFILPFENDIEKEQPNHFRPTANLSNGCGRLRFCLISGFKIYKINHKMRDISLLFLYTRPRTFIYK